MRLYSTAVVAAVLAASATIASAQTPATGEANFTILAGGVQIGQQRATLSRDASGWIITSTGRLGAAGDLTINRFEMRYAPDWQPLELKIDAIDHRTSVALATSFAMTTAINEVTRQGKTVSKEDQISARTIVIASNYYASYEALAARLSTAAAGAELPIYIAPNGEVKATVRSVTAETLRGPATETPVRRFELAVPNGQAQTQLVVTIDDRSRLVRLEIPSAGLTVVRDDLSSVSTRVVAARNPTDADVTIPANGFVLGATITTPSSVAGRLRYPVVVLVSAPGAGRDAPVAGVPIFAQLAGALANAGQIAVRYDNRGVALSGGRTESATLTDYADDLIAIVKWLGKRKDVDGRRIVVCGYGQGSAVAMIAMSREKDIDGLVTLDSPAGTGAEVLLEQQQQVLAGLSIPDAEKQAKIDLQKKIQNAVVSGTGWESVPPEMRRQADTPLFKSQLTFDPSLVLAKTKQPMLIVQPDAGSRVPASSAERLENLARDRKKAAGVEVAHVPEVNASVATAIADWIKKTL